MRINWVDNAKALGILAIVLGHAPGLNEHVIGFLYTFHVPLFFFLSGILIKSKHLDMPFKQFLVRNAQRLVVPYLFFWVVSLVLWAVFQTIEGNSLLAQPDGLLTQVEGLLMGTGIALLGVNGVLWFYTALFVTTLVLYFLARLSTLAFIAALGVCFVVGAFIRPVFAGQHLPWNIELIPVVMVFYGAGFLLAREGWMPTLSKLVWSLIAIGGFALTLLILKLNGKADFSWQVWGYSYAKFIIGAGAGIAMTVGLGQLLGSSRLARYLSDNTITIFSVHFPMFTAFALIGIYGLGLDKGFEQQTSVIGLVYTGLAFLLCIPIISMLRRYFPGVIGARTRTQN